MSAPIVQWICSELSNLMQFEATEDIARYILAIESKEDLEEYMLELLDGSEKRNTKFIKELLLKWRPPNEDGLKVYQKNADEECYIKAQGTTKSKKKKWKTKAIDHNQSNEINGIENSQPADISEKAESMNLDNSTASHSKKKNKFVSLYSNEGQAKTIIKLPGRHGCECQASKHALISNCLRCGRVVCEQEGSGPCLYCGNLVCTREEQEILSRGSKKSERLRQQLMKLHKVENGDSGDLPHQASRINDGLQKAVEHKEKLLEYDKSCARRTQVIDDESDYFATEGNSWLTTEERSKLKSREAELRQQRHGSRLDRKITFDFAGRRIIDAEMESVVNMYDRHDKIVQEVHYGGAKTKSVDDDTPKLDLSEFSDLVNPVLSYTKQSAPKYVPPEQRYSTKVSNHSEVKSKTLRLQDKELQEMADDGVCLSMHQPWASLLIAGIKKHEGRTWYSAHRGRLYIAATAKTPTQEEIDELEEFYRQFYKKPRLRFPEHYPVGCLLGCVDVTDCLAQDEYRKQFPGGESSSPFVFIGQNPQELLVKFPIKGKHKIYNLEGHIHQAAKKGLRRVDCDV
ncbi:activating signal cointegrator 1-like [Tubulanus polymorphus]|uniref:activating signal cointegrator 1-like n=1 Tax=Tubulanus polymorphus TaxID=672921 RepID=UPI003DA1F7FC